MFGFRPNSMRHSPLQCLAGVNALVHFALLTAQRKSRPVTRLILFMAVGSTGMAARGLEPTTPLVEYGRQSWVMENGLPQNSVHALVQSQDGFLWLGTEAGLVRFDGASFLVLDQRSQPGLPSGDIRYLAETEDGTLWVGTAEGLARRR